MANPEFSRRISIRAMNDEITSFHGLNTISDHIFGPSEVTLADIQVAYRALLAKQQTEPEPPTPQPGRD